MSISVRRASAADARELTRLRIQMFTDMGRDATQLDDEWRTMMTAHFEERLPDVDRFAAFVVDGSPGRLAACAVGWLDRHLPNTAGANAVVGHIANVSTDPEWRRRGYARSTVSGLLDWMRRREARTVNLNATPAAEELYRSLGFADPSMPALILRIE